MSFGCQISSGSGDWSSQNFNIHFSLLKQTFLVLWYFQLMFFITFWKFSILYGKLHKGTVTSQFTSAGEDEEKIIHTYLNIKEPAVMAIFSPMKPMINPDNGITAPCVIPQVDWTTTKSS